MISVPSWLAGMSYPRPSNHIEHGVGTSVPTPLPSLPQRIASLVKQVIGLVGLALWLAACSDGSTPPARLPEPSLQSVVPQAISTPTLPGMSLPASPTLDSIYTSNGGGEPRSPGYWIQWSTCGENSQAAVAAANGGRQAGWIILDDILADPGVLLGELEVETCQAGVSLLQGRNLEGAIPPDDSAYPLAAQLLAAQVNLAVGSESCPAIDTAVVSSQLLLISLDFDGIGEYLVTAGSADQRQLSLFLAGELAQYNTGELCR